MSRKNLSSDKINRLGLLTIIVLVLAIVPLSVWAISQPVSYLPKATSSDSTSLTTASTHKPKLTSPIITRTLTCAVGQTCDQAFVITDGDSDDSLSLEINFLPPNLQANTCEQVYLPSRTTLNCSFSGIPERPGEYKLLLTASDSTQNLENTTFTLNITE